MKKFTLIAGPCAMEEFDTAFEIANQVKAICSELNIHYIFKASYKKANRSKLDSFTGIGDVEALEMIKKLVKIYPLIRLPIFMKVTKLKKCQLM